MSTGKKVNKKASALFFFTMGWIAFTTVYWQWWDAVAPYCCTHMCGCTISMAECAPGMLISVFVIIIIIFSMWTIMEFLDGSNEAPPR